MSNNDYLYGLLDLSSDSEDNPWTPNSSNDQEQYELNHNTFQPVQRPMYQEEYELNPSTPLDTPFTPYEDWQYSDPNSLQKTVTEYGSNPTANNSSLDSLSNEDGLTPLNSNRSKEMIYSINPNIFNKDNKVQNVTSNSSSSRPAKKPKKTQNSRHTSNVESVEPKRRRINKPRAPRNPQQEKELKLVYATNIRAIIAKYRNMERQKINYYVDLVNELKNAVPDNNTSDKSLSRRISKFTGTFDIATYEEAQTNVSNNIDKYPEDDPHGLRDYLNENDLMGKIGIKMFRIWNEYNYLQLRKGFFPIAYQTLKNQKIPKAQTSGHPRRCKKCGRLNLRS